MGKKITLTHFDNKPIELDVDDIHVVGPKDKGAYIVLKTKKVFLVMESQSRILRMIARASTYNTLNEGDEVKIKILDYFIFEDDGKDQIKIMT